MTAVTLTAIGGLAAIAINTLLVLGIRRGLPDEPWVIALLIGYGAVILCSAVAIELLVRCPLRRALAQPIALIGLLLLPIAFFGFTFWLFLATAAILVCAAMARSRLAHFRLQPDLVMGLGPALCLIVAVGLYGLAGYQHSEMQTHFFMPEYADLGLLHQDPMAYATFAAQIIRGQWPGQALDGLQPMLYHFGVHWILASFSAASASTPFYVYMLGQQLLFIPLLIFYAGLATASLCRTAGASEQAGAIAVVLAMGGIVAVPCLGWPVLYYSESSSASAPFLFLMLPIASAWLRPDAERRPGMLHAFVLILASMLPLVFKISTAMMTAPITGYLVLRRLLSPKRSDITAMAAIGLALFSSVLVWPSLFGHGFEFRLWNYAGEFTAVRLEASGVIWALVIAFLLDRAGLALDLREPRLRSHWRILLMMLPVAVFGTWIIGNVHRVYNGRYLFNALLLLTIPLLAVGAAPLLRFAISVCTRRLPLLKGAAWLVLGSLLVLVMAATMEVGRASPSLTDRRIDGAIMTMCRRAIPQATCLANHPRAFHTASPVFTASLEQGVGPRTLAALSKFDLAAADGIFVPPHNTAYWDLILGGMEPYENLNFLPAHFGVPMLLGLPPAELGVALEVINTPLSTRYDERARSRSIGDAELCRHARERNMRRVWVYESLGPPAAMRLLDCRQTE